MKIVFATNNEHKLKEVRENKSINYKKIEIKEKESIIEKLPININVLVRNEEQLLAVLDKVDNIYTEDSLLYEKYKNRTNIYLKLPRVKVNARVV